MKYIKPARIGFFFGAGASTNFGLPTMKTISSKFTKEMENENEDINSLYFDIYSKLEQIYGKYNIDIESIFSIIHGIKEKENFDEYVGDFAHYLAQHQFTKKLDYPSLLSDTGIHNLECKFKEFIRQNFKIKPDGYKHIEEVYENFFITIGKKLDSKHIFGNKNFPAHPWNFFTTNYDTVLEHFWRNHIEYDENDGLKTGFYGSNKRMDPDNFIKDSGMKLIKLHGSLNWLEKNDRSIREIEIAGNIDEAKQNSSPGTFMEEMVIYPLFQKQLYVSPYLQLFYMFNHELRKRNIWIIIGYSFRDAIIKNIFNNYLLEKNNKIILIDPDPKISKLFSNFKTQVHLINRKFGEKSSFIETNALIANELENM